VFIIKDSHFQGCVAEFQSCFNSYARLLILFCTTVRYKKNIYSFTSQARDVFSQHKILATTRVMSFAGRWVWKQQQPFTLGAYI